MVKLDNPYARQRPSLKILIPMLLLYPLLTLIMNYSYFSFVYQYSIILLLLIIIAQFSDHRLFTRERMFSFDISFERAALYLLALIIMLIPIRNIAALFSQTPQIMQFYTGLSCSFESLLIMIIIIAPCEELFFRGFIQHNLSMIFGKYGGIITGAIMYSVLGIAAHSLYLTVLFFIIGMIIGYYYSRTSSLVLTTVLHICTIIFMFLFPY